MHAKNPIPQKVGLALSGGSTRGIAHIGALKALVENNIRIDCISGTSAGALVAACFAFGMPVSEMVERTRKLTWRKFSRPAYSKLGLTSSEPMGRLLTDALGDVRIEDAKIPLSIVATNIETHEMVALRSGSLREAVRASTCFPGLFTPVELNGMLLVDGGLTERLPLSTLKEMGATITIGVNLQTGSVQRRPTNLIEILYASFDIISKPRDEEFARKADILIEPDMNKFGFFQFTNAEDMINVGYQAAMKEIPAIRAKIGTPEQEPASAFSISEILSKLFGKHN